MVQLAKEEQAADTGSRITAEPINMNTLDETLIAQLLERLRAGDDQAANELVRQYEPELRRFIRYRMTNSQMRRMMDSLDVAQSVFARFFVHFSEGNIHLTSARQLFKLLMTIATNRINDYGRRQSASKRDGKLIADYSPEALANVGDGSEMPDNQVADEELAQMFWSRLADEERRLLQGRMDGKSWQELADTMPEGRGSPEALRKRLARAIDRVAEELGWGPES